MILGKIIGKVTTREFTFSIEGSGVHKFDYIQAPHQESDYVLCQITEIEKTKDYSIAKCKVIGSIENGKVVQLKTPLEPGTEILHAENSLIEKIIKTEKNNGAYVGKLEGRDIKIHLDLNKILTKHVAVLAKSGSGKSYAVGVLLEEIISKKIPLVVIDPHGEYNTLSEKNKNKNEINEMAEFGINPETFPVEVFGDGKLSGSRPLKLASDFTQNELIEFFPGKLTGNQMGVLYNAIKDMKQISFNQLLLALEQEESNVKWNIINIVQYLNSLGIFSSSNTPFNELVRPGVASIINLKGINPDVQQIITFKLCSDLFELRKKEKISPFFLVIEEAHNFCPERSFGEAKSSRVLRNIASEGRKFGLGLCVVSQRPARVDKSVLSQCSTQIILKITNPNDIKAVSNSVEGLTLDTEKEMQNLSIGTALITGVADTPLFVNIRPRKSQHGGHAIDLLSENLEVKDEIFEDKIKDFDSKELLPVVAPEVSAKDLILMSDKKITVDTVLVPGFVVDCKDKTSFQLLIERESGSVVSDINSFSLKKIPNLSSLTKTQLNILQGGFELKKFTIKDMMNKINNLNIDSDFSALVNNGFFGKVESESSNHFGISSDFIFARLSSVPFYGKIEFSNINFHRKLDPKIDIDTLKETLSPYTNIVDFKDCFIVKHEVNEE